MHEDSSISISGLDGYPLGATIHRAGDQGSVQAVIVLSSAAGVQRKFYRHYAEYLAENGFTVITYDYRGVGDSRPDDLREMRATMQDWGRLDLAGVIDWMRNQLAPSRWLLIGHSAGGQMTGLASNNGDAAGLLLVASQSGYWRLWPVSAQFRWLWLWYILLPVMTRLYGYTPTSKLNFGNDLPAGVGLEWAHWCRNPDFIVDAQGKAIREHFHAFRSPILAFSMEDDGNAPARAVDELLSYFGSKSKEHCHLRPAEIGAEAIGHFGFFRPEFRDTLWRESLEWIKDRL